MDIFFSASTKSANSGIWGVPVWWPFSTTAYAYPLVPWGDVGATVILAAGMFALALWRAHLCAIAIASLATVAGYMIVCGAVG